MPRRNERRACIAWRAALKGGPVDFQRRTSNKNTLSTTNLPYYLHDLSILYRLDQYQVTQEWHGEGAAPRPCCGHEKVRDGNDVDAPTENGSIIDVTIWTITTMPFLLDNLKPSRRTSLRTTPQVSYISIRPPAGPRANTTFWSDAFTLGLKPSCEYIGQKVVFALGTRLDRADTYCNNEQQLRLFIVSQVFAVTSYFVEVCWFIFCV